MHFVFTRAIVRPPAANFATGLTTVDLGLPEYESALAQHEAYCQALERCGLELIRLAPDEDFPDSTFVEDTAVLTDKCAVISRPGAVSRAGEVAGIRTSLNQFYPSMSAIEAAGTLDGGDICEAGNHFFIGISERTNETGAQQLAEILGRHGYTSSLVDIREAKEILHLKSGIAYLGSKHLAIIASLADRSEFRGYDLVRLNAGDEYAANCIRVNDHVLIASGYPEFDARLRELGYQTIALEMSEFQKMDGGLSCLSLRF